MLSGVSNKEPRWRSNGANETLRLFGQVVADSQGQAGERDMGAGSRVTGVQIRPVQRLRATVWRPVSPVLMEPGNPKPPF